MKKSRFTDSQIMATWKQHAAVVQVAELARDTKLRSALIYPVALELWLNERIDDKAPEGAGSWKFPFKED